MRKARSAVIATGEQAFAASARTSSTIAESPSVSACTTRSRGSGLDSAGTPARAEPSNTTVTGLSSVPDRSAAASWSTSRAAAPGRSRHQPFGREPTTFAASTTRCMMST
ncbi:MAG: hypothetical protein JO100_06690 [Pseudonocardia sp.]|nr:hypothetical protein [Pseudonocardia sp.]